MRALALALLLIAVALIALPSPARAGSQCTTTICKASITRTIATNSWGVTVVTDNVLLNSSSQVSQLLLGVPTNMSNDLRITEAVDSAGTNLQVVSTANQTYTGLTVTFASPETHYNFTLTTIYWGLLRYAPGASGYTFSINPFPVIDRTYNASAKSTFTYTGGWSTPKVAPPVNQTLQSAAYVASSLSPYNGTIWKITFASASSQNLFLVGASRTITITPSNAVQVTDAYNLTNLGPTVSSIPFTVPKGVSGISETYVLGLEIDQPSTSTTATSNPDGTSTVSFVPGFGALPYNQTVKVKISYTLAPSAYLSSKSLGTFTLNFALFSNVQFYAPSLQTKIVTPMGFRLNSVTGQVPQSSGSQLEFQTSSVSPTSNLGFTMTYQLDPFWATVSPLSWAVLIELALAASAVAVWRGAGVAGAAGVPVQLISKFADLYDEKSSMSMESEKMDEDVARGSLNRYDYRQRRR